MPPAAKGFRPLETQYAFGQLPFQAGGIGCRPGMGQRSWKGKTVLRKAPRRADTLPTIMGRFGGGQDKCHGLWDKRDAAWALTFTLWRGDVRTSPRFGFGEAPPTISSTSRCKSPGAVGSGAFFHKNERRA